MRDPSALLPLLADAGIPMIFLTFPAMLVLLVPVIAIEGLLCKKWLGLSMWQAMKSNAVSNLASTIIGVPMAWAIMFGVEVGTMGVVDKSQIIQHWHSPIANVIFFFLSSAWIPPVEGKDVWLIPAAALVLLLPFFFVSYGLEYVIMKFMVATPEGEPKLAYSHVRVSVRNANLVTYGAMFLVTSVWLLLSLKHR